MVNIPKLKGVHLAMHAGMFAAETIYEKLKSRVHCNDLSNYQEKVEDSVIEKDLHRSRNMRQVFGKGFLIGGALANAMEISGGRFPGGRFATHDDATVDVFIGNRARISEARRQVHLRQALVGLRDRQRHARRRARTTSASRRRCRSRWRSMWQQMCPAQVYEVPEEVLEAAPRKATARSTPSRRSRCRSRRRNKCWERQARGRRSRSRRRTACSAAPSPPRAAA